MVRMGEISNAFRIIVGKPDGICHLEDLDANGRALL
jgi:hypothetical protein